MKQPSNSHIDKATVFKYSFILILILLINACATTNQGIQSSPGDNLLAPAYQQKIDLLQKDLATLSYPVNLTEAGQLAETSIITSLQLADEYQLIRPAIFHNILVRIGIKNRGLCYHWTEDLMKRLVSLELKSFHLHWGVAHLGSDLREHNSVVVTAKGQDFSEGIVLDPWRNSGKLFWIRIKDDRYPWKKRQPNE